MIKRFIVRATDIKLIKFGFLLKNFLMTITANTYVAHYVKVMMRFFFCMILKPDKFFSSRKMREMINSCLIDVPFLFRSTKRGKGKNK